MHSLCRGLAVVVASATLGTAVPSIANADDPPVSPVGTVAAIDPVDAILAELGAGQAGDLDAAVAALTPEQVKTLLGRVATGDLAAVAGTLSPSQISQLAGVPGGLSAAAGALQAAVSGLAAGAPSAGAVNAISAQVTALLGATPTAALPQLNGLLTQFAPLLQTDGLDQTGLADLFNAAVAALAAPEAPSGLRAITNVIITGNPNPPAPTPEPAATPTATATAKPRTDQASAAFRLRVVKVKLARNRRSLYVVLRGPASAPLASAKISGPGFETRSVVLERSATKVLTLRLRPSAVQRGRTLKVTATTRGSSLRPSVISVPVR